MVQTKLTSKERAYAATAGVSGTPFTTPPGTPGRRGSQPAKNDSNSLALPRSAYYIIFVEGCERFCFYGLKTVLLLYFMRFLLMGKDSATVAYHIFSSACYFTPVIGAIISDGFIGRYWTILILSIIYFSGTVFLTVTAVPSIGHRQLWGPAIGLGLIALGTGGIKPCVNAFGADQITTTNPKTLSRYFAFFYFAINCGSLLSTLLTPLLRSQIHCFGYDCYTVAFAVPSFLMLCAITIFILGTSQYKRIPPKENIIVKFVAIIFRALRNGLCRSSSESRADWLGYADDRYDSSDINDVRAVVRVCVLFTPIIIFQALFDQIGSRWTYQASLMDGSLGGLGTIQPDQMQALNSFFVLLFIPIFEEVIYPMFARCNFLIRHLQRMFVGLLVMVVAFVVAALVQSTIQSRYETIPVRLTTNVFNGYSCPIIVGNETIEMKKAIEVSCKEFVETPMVFRSKCDGKSQIFQLSDDQICPSVFIISKMTSQSNGNDFSLTSLANSLTQGRAKNGHALLRYEVWNTPTNVESSKTIEISTTAIYTALIYANKDNQFGVILFEDVPPSTVHILWQIPQYFLITSSEILVSVTGLVFAYSQAPRRYKTVIMSGWLLTTAFGDLIVVFVAETRLVADQALEFVLFAILMTFGAFIFGILAIHYTETKFDNAESEDQQLILDRSGIEGDDVFPLTN